MVPVQEKCANYHLPPTPHPEYPMTPPDTPLPEARWLTHSLTIQLPPLSIISSFLFITYVQDSLWVVSSWAGCELWVTWAGCELWVTWAACDGLGFSCLWWCSSTKTTAYEALFILYCTLTIVPSMNLSSSPSFCCRMSHQPGIATVAICRVRIPILPDKRIPYGSI